jgi:hypothetical protein
VEASSLRHAHLPGRVLKPPSPSHEPRDSRATAVLAHAHGLPSVSSGVAVVHPHTQVDLLHTPSAAHRPPKQQQQPSPGVAPSSHAHHPPTVVARPPAAYSHGQVGGGGGEEAAGHRRKLPQGLSGSGGSKHTLLYMDMFKCVPSPARVSVYGPMITGGPSFRNLLLAMHPTASIPLDCLRHTEQKFHEGRTFVARWSIR